MRPALMEDVSFVKLRWLAFMRFAIDIEYDATHVTFRVVEAPSKAASSKLFVRTMGNERTLRQGSPLTFPVASGSFLLHT